MRSELSGDRQVLTFSADGGLRRRNEATEVLDGADSFECTGHDLTGAGTMRLVDQTCFEQFRVGENDTQLVVEAMEHSRELAGSQRRRRYGKRLSGQLATGWGLRTEIRSHGLRCRSQRAGLVGSVAGLAVAPQSVFEDAHRSTGGPDVLNLATGDPVVDGSAADANQLARTRNRNCLSVKMHRRCRPRGAFCVVYRR